MKSPLLGTILVLAACGGPEVDILLRQHSSVTETLVLLQPQIHEVDTSDITVFPTVHVGDGAFTLPLPEDNHAFMIRIDACGEGDDCGVHNRVAAACSQVMSVASGEPMPAMFLTFFPVQPGQQGCP